MEYYSLVKPDLVGPIMKNTMAKISQVGADNNTVSDKIVNTMTEFYESHIKENKVVFIILIAITVFFVYRYYEKQDRLTSESFANQDLNELQPKIDEQTAYLKYDTQPYFNPLLPVADQPVHVNYPPDPLPIRLPKQGLTYTRNIYNDPTPYPSMNLTAGKYDYSAVNNMKDNTSRVYHSGTYNPYKCNQDTSIINALGYPVDFNTTTGTFVGGMTDKNRETITDYQSILDTMNQNLVDSLRIGPKYVNIDTSPMDPPYANDLS